MNEHIEQADRQKDRWTERQDGWMTAGQTMDNEDCVPLGHHHQGSKASGVKINRNIQSFYNICLIQTGCSH